MDLPTFTSIALLVGLIVTAQNLLRYLRAHDWNGAFGIVLACLLGWAVVLVAAHASVTAKLLLITDGPPLGDLDFGSLLLLGVAIGSLGPLIVDFRKAFDNTATAEKPALVPPPPDGP